MSLHRALPFQEDDQRPREKFDRRRMRHRRPIPTPAQRPLLLYGAVLVGALVMLAACDITQDHIDQASEQIANATVANGSPPTAAQIAAGVALKTDHIAGSTWRLIAVSAWPDAEGVVTLGSNGRAVWHVHTDHRYSELGHWKVTAGVFEMADSATSWRGGHAGIRIDANTVCLESGGNRCSYLLQRVTP
ncbi:MAG: hypothetical protein OXJ90_07300 [Spirochaetaceae bacterium]|nr:hypothetical protein [Spirochaetaceae bacterium]